MQLSRTSARNDGLRVGSVVDIVVFDPDTIDATATYDDPRRQPQGIQHVLVNGEYTLRASHRTDRLPAWARDPTHVGVDEVGYQEIYDHRRGLLTAPVSLDM